MFCAGAARNRCRAGFADPPYVQERNFGYYLLKPDATVWWSDVSDSQVDRLVTEHPDIVIDLGNLDRDARATSRRSASMASPSSSSPLSRSLNRVSLL